MTVALIEVERHAVNAEGVVAAVVRLNRPENGNALSLELLGELESVIDGLAVDVAVRAILLTGSAGVFVAGGDIKQAQAVRSDPLAFTAFIKEFQRLLEHLREIPLPVIALVNGMTAAGGLEILLYCDVVIAARSATIRDGHLNVGQMGGGGMLALLPRLIGLQRASELVFTGRPLSAEEAERWGLINRCVDDERLTDTGLELVKLIATTSRLAIANAKEVMTSTWNDRIPVSAALRLERERSAYYVETSVDAAEGMAAFVEKRRPNFTGR